MAPRVVRRVFGLFLVLVLAGIALGLPPLSPPPAAAAPAAVTLTLTQSSADSAIGTEVTLTARLTVPAGPLPEPAGGWFIEFSGTQGGGWSSGPIKAVDGVAAYRISSPVDATDDITASVANPDCTATGMTDSVTHTWWTPEISLFEGGADRSSWTGDTFTLQGTVSRSGAPVPGATVEVTVKGLDDDGPEQPTSDPTGADGEFSASWDQGDANLEEVDITATAPGGFKADLVTSHVWNIPSEGDYDLRIRTYEDEAPPRVGDDLFVSPVLYSQGYEQSLYYFGPFSYWDTGDWQPGDSEHFSYIYPSPNSAGWQVLGVRSDEIGAVGGLAVRWSQPKITFLAPDGTSPNGDPYSATVLVTDGYGNPVPGMRLAFTIHGEDQPYATESTDDHGMATTQTPIPGQTSRSLTIDVTETTDATASPAPEHHAATASTTHSWVSLPRLAPIVLTTPPSLGSESRVGTAVPFTAHVSDSDDHPLPNWDVDFYLVGEEQPFATARTDTNGDASATLSRSSESADRVYASVWSTCEEEPRYSVPRPHYWWQTELDLQPKDEVSRARQQVTFAADVARTVQATDAAGIDQGSRPGADDPTAESRTSDTRSTRSPAPEGSASGSASASDRKQVTPAAIPLGMDPLADQQVRFTMTSQSCDLPVVVAQATTNNEGRAEVALTRGVPNIDSVHAEEIGVFDPASDTTTHTWGEPDPPPLSIALAQSSAASRAGTSVTLTATVYDADQPNGRAEAGTRVTFLGTPHSATAQTDGNGVARLTFTGTGTADSSLTATTPYGCGVVVSPSIAHRWFVPDLVLSPDTATSTTGSQASVTASLTYAGDPIGEQQIRLTIDHSASGQPTKTITKKTDDNGEATFAWTRTVAGTDTLTATELVAVMPQQDTAKHIWKALPVTPPPTPSPTTPSPTTPSPSPTPTPTPTTPSPTTPSPTTKPSATAQPTAEPSATEPAAAEPTVTDEPSAEPTERPTHKPTKKPTSPPTTPPEEPTDDLPASSTMVDGPEVGRPGGDIQLSGTGCKPGEQVTVHLGDKDLGQTRAAADGTFYLRAAVPDLELGRYVIRSSCGTTVGDPNVDITAPQVDRAGGALATAGVTTASMLVFFILIAKGVISFLPRKP